MWAAARAAAWAAARAGSSVGSSVGSQQSGQQRGQQRGQQLGQRRGQQHESPWCGQRGRWRCGQRCGGGAGGVGSGVCGGGVGSGVGGGGVGSRGGVGSGVSGDRAAKAWAVRGQRRGRRKCGRRWGGGGVGSHVGGGRRRERRRAVEQNDEGTVTLNVVGRAKRRAGDFDDVGEGVPQARLAARRGAGRRAGSRFERRRQFAVAGYGDRGRLRVTRRQIRTSGRGRLAAAMVAASCAAANQVCPAACTLQARSISRVRRLLRIRTGREGASIVIATVARGAVRRAGFVAASIVSSNVGCTLFARS